jgi:hypothetical protein
MRPTMLSGKNASYLFDHVLDGFKSSFEGIKKLKAEKLITDDEYIELLTKNSTRLVERVREFKFVNKMMCIFYALAFLLLQVNGDDLDMRRTSARVRTGTRAARGSRGNRREEAEPIELTV